MAHEIEHQVRIQLPGEIGLGLVQDTGQANWNVPGGEEEAIAPMAPDPLDLGPSRVPLLDREDAAEGLALRPGDRS